MRPSSTSSVRTFEILAAPGSNTYFFVEQYFEMSHIDAAEALSIYRHFCKQTEHVTEYLGVAKKLQNLLNVPIPNLRHVRFYRRNLAYFLMFCSRHHYPLRPPCRNTWTILISSRTAWNTGPIGQLQTERLCPSPPQINPKPLLVRPAFVPPRNVSNFHSAPKPDTKSGASASTSNPAQPAASGPTSSVPQEQQKKTNIEDFFNSIEENQTSMFNQQAPRFEHSSLMSLGFN